MKSEWRVSSQYIDGNKFYTVYRLRNISATDHSGNREYYGGSTSDRAEALKLAEELNEKEN